MEKGGLHNLQTLHFIDRTSLENLPLGIEDLGKLKYLELEDLSFSLINRIEKAKGSKDFIRLQHVPEVRVLLQRWNSVFIYIVNRLIFIYPFLLDDSVLVCSLNSSSQVKMWSLICNRSCYLLSFLLRVLVLQLLFYLLHSVCV